MPDLPDTEFHPLNHSTLVLRDQAETSEEVRSVLCLDDDWEHLSARCALLENAGYRVEATDSPAAGLSSYIRNGFDAVILDFHLPFVSSDLLAAVMRRFRRDIPLILISDQAELAANELGTMDRQLPRDTSQMVILDNVYDIIGRGRKSSADQVQESIGHLGHEVRTRGVP